MKTNRTVLSFDCDRWWQFPQLACYARWLERLLDHVLPGESLSFDNLEFRYERAGSDDKEVDRWHADGSYVRSICTLFGATTVYRE